MAYPISLNENLPRPQIPNLPWKRDRPKIRWQSDDIIQYSSWFTLLLLCTGAPSVLCGDRFNHGSRQVKREPVDLATEDYDISLVWE